MYILRSTLVRRPSHAKHFFAFYQPATELNQPTSQELLPLMLLLQISGRLLGLPARGTIGRCLVPYLSLRRCFSCLHFILCRPSSLSFISLGNIFGVDLRPSINISTLFIPRKLNASNSSLYRCTDPRYMFGALSKVERPSSTSRRTSKRLLTSTPGSLLIPFADLRSALAFQTDIPLDR